MSLLQVIHLLPNQHKLAVGTALCEVSDILFIHSFSSLYYDRSKASSKASSPNSAIQSFLFQMRISSPFLKVIQQLPTSSSLFSCHFYPPLYLSFSNPLQKAVSTQNVTNPVRLPLTYFMQDIPLLLDSKQYIFISHMISPTDTTIC